MQLRNAIIIMCRSFLEQAAATSSILARPDAHHSVGKDDGVEQKQNTTSEKFGLVYLDYCARLYAGENTPVLVSCSTFASHPCSNPCPSSNMLHSPQRDRRGQVGMGMLTSASAATDCAHPQCMLSRMEHKRFKTRQLELMLTMFNFACLSRLLPV